MSIARLELSPVEIAVDDAFDLTRVGRDHGVRSQRQARKHPSLFGNLIVRNPGSFANHADLAIRHASIKNLALKAICEDGGEGSDEFHEVLESLDLHIPIGGEELSKAIDVSRFALRVVSATTPTNEPYRLYTDQDPDYRLNSPENWNRLMGVLIPELVSAPDLV